MSFEYVLHEISYANFLLYSAAIPSFGSKSKKETQNKSNEIIKADDPKNRELVKAIIQGYKF